MTRGAYDYGRIAWCYDELAAVYSLGRIRRSKLAFLSELEPGQRVLFAGVGRGEEALAAARAGASVTAVDVSGAMLARLARRARTEGLALELVERDVAELDSAGEWDHVVAHYFLNCFEAAEAERLASRLALLVAPGGALHLADFAPPAGNAFARLVTHAYYRAVNLAGWALRLCALHPIPDLPALLRRSGFEVTAVRRFPIAFAGSPAYQSVTGRAPGVARSRTHPPGAFP